MRKPNAVERIIARSIGETLRETIDVATRVALQRLAGRIVARLDLDPKAFYDLIDAEDKA
jgi:hypothetical protein